MFSIMSKSTSKTEAKVYLLGPLKLFLKYCFILLKQYFLDVRIIAVRIFFGVNSLFLIEN